MEYRRDFPWGSGCSDGTFRVLGTWGVLRPIVLGVSAYYCVQEVVAIRVLLVSGLQHEKDGRSHTLWTFDQSVMLDTDIFIVQIIL